MNTFMTYETQNGSRKVGVVYPNVSDEKMELNPGSVVCSNIATSSCAIEIRSDDNYTITITLMNDEGTTTEKVMFDCKLAHLTFIVFFMDFTKTCTNPITVLSLHWCVYTILLSQKQFCL